MMVMLYERRRATTTESTAAAAGSTAYVQRATNNGHDNSYQVRVHTTACCLLPSVGVDGRNSTFQLLLLLLLGGRACAHTDDSH